MRCAEAGGASRLVGSYPIRADSQLTLWTPCLQDRRRCSVFQATWWSYRTIATTLSAAGVDSDNSPARVMSSMECSVMNFE